MTRTKPPTKRRTKPPATSRRTKPTLTEEEPKTNDDTLLLDVLESGTACISSTGTLCFIVRTTRRNPKYDERMYKLHYPRQKDGQWWMPEITGSDYYTRDKLYTMGLMLNPNEPNRRQNDDQNNEDE